MKSVVILCLLGDPMIPPTSEPSRAGGYNIDVKQWLEHLAGLSVNIVVITNLSSHFQKIKEVISPSITLYRVEIREDSLKNGYALMDQYPSVREYIIKLLSDAKTVPIFFHSYYWYNGLLARDFSEIYGVPYIHTIIDSAAYKLISGDKLLFPKQLDIEKDVFSNADYLLAITNSEKNVLLSHYPLTPNQIIVTGHEADSVFLNPDHDIYGRANAGDIPKNEIEDRHLGLKEDALNKWWNTGAFLYFGRLVEMKGIRYIIKA